jgi:predicted transcriptional regulator YdeE
MEPKIEKRQAFTVVGMRYHGKPDQNEIPRLWSEFGPREGEVEPKTDPPTCYGIMDNHDEASGEFDYVAAFEVERAVDIPDGMVRWEVPEQTYAVFTCTLPTIAEAYEYAHSEWLPVSGYRHAAGPYFELYNEEFDPENPESELYIYIPINK